jgi:hypothetical protein
MPLGNFDTDCFGCGLSGARALGANSPAVEAPEVIPLESISFWRGYALTGSLLRNPARSDSRSTASRRQLSSRSSEVAASPGIQRMPRWAETHIAVGTLASCGKISVRRCFAEKLLLPTAALRDGIPKDCPSRRAAPKRAVSTEQQPGERNSRTRPKKQSSVARVAHAGASAAGHVARARAATGATGTCVAAGACTAASTCACAAASARRRAASTRARDAAGARAAASAAGACAAAVVTTVVAASVRRGESQRAD